MSITLPAKGLKALVERNGFRVAKVEQITRIPYNALSRRLRLKGKPAAIVDGLVSILQTPFSALMNYFRAGNLHQFICRQETLSESYADCRYFDQKRASQSPCVVWRPSLNVIPL